MSKTNGTLTINSDSPQSRNGHSPSGGIAGFDAFFQVVSRGAGLTANGPPDGVSRAGEIVANALLSRAEMIRTMMDPRRDIYDACGIVKGPIPLQQYQLMFEREAIASRVVECLPKETWQVRPTVYEDERGDKVTAWEEAWDATGPAIRGGKSWFGADEDSDHPANELFELADVLCGIGHYDVMLLGIDDGRELYEPADLRGVEPTKFLVQDPSASGLTLAPGITPTPTTTRTKLPDSPGAKAERALQYVSVFPEGLVYIKEFDKDARSPRFGLPTEYVVQLSSPYYQTGPTTGALPAAQPQRVHWSRIVHVIDNRETSKVFGAPRMRPVFNNLHALMKLYHGSAEMYWMGAFPGLAITSAPQLQGGTATRMPFDKLKDMMEAYFNDLQRWIGLQGMDAKTLSPQVVSPRDQIEVQIEAICIKLGIPKRIFMGSERGELASSQDDASWNDRLRSRQRGHCNPRIIMPFADRLIQLGCLPVPKKPLRIWWPSLDSQTAADKASVAKTKTDTLVAYAGKPEAQEGYGWFDFLTRVLGHTEEEAQVIMETAEQERQAREEQQLALFRRQSEESGGQRVPEDNDASQMDALEDSNDDLEDTDDEWEETPEEQAGVAPQGGVR